jgi:hypothetical protein
MNKTAMQQLKEKIQVVIGEMNGELSSYESGYKQCLINIQNDIDLQMMAMEKEQIVNACNLQRNDYRGMPTYNKSGEQYYNETYVHDTHRTHPSSP